jgi:hypothetical protein
MWKSLKLQVYFAKKMIFQTLDFSIKMLALDEKFQGDKE